MTDETAVLVAGGGLSGLTSALLLADLGINCVVVERHPGTSIQYKFAGISPRSMEIFRALGIEDDIRRHRTGDQQAGGIARCRTLSDSDVQWMLESAWPDVAGLSPTNPATCDQHVLEPILRAHAERRGADVRFNTELTTIRQHGDAIEAVVRDRGTGREHTIRAAYMIAADGANGPAREWLGIDRTGPGELQHWMNLIFETNLSPFLDGKRFTSCFVTSLNGTFTPRESGRWLLALQYDPKREQPDDFDAERCRALVQTGAGRSDVSAELVDARSWDVAACVANSFRSGRAFLVGDAAHVMPPTGAFGGNTGIHDAHNLAWKLAFVLNGHAEPGLLDTYDTERRTVAVHTLEQALARLQAWFEDPQGRLPPPVDIVDSYDVVFGQRYDKGAVVGASGDDSKRAFAPARELSGRPGTRAPYLVVADDGRKMPIQDLFGKQLILLTGSEGAAWSSAAETVRTAGIPLQVCRIGAGDLSAPEGGWPDRYGLTDSGAALVRPDGFVAWRVREAPHDARSALVDALERLRMRVNASV